MGEFTVLQKGDGWIVLEDGRRVGGTLRYPFPTREAAERHIERELADESKLRANGDFAKSAKCKVMRETNAELWALFANIEKEFADEDEAHARSRTCGRGHFDHHDSLRDGRLRSRRRYLPHWRDARWETSVRPNKIEWEHTQFS
jgi:hypothetical protein